jgi:hypothetical protein
MNVTISSVHTNLQSSLDTNILKTWIDFLKFEIPSTFIRMQ